MERNGEEAEKKIVFIKNCLTLSIWEGANQFQVPGPAGAIFHQITGCGYSEIN